MLTTNQIVRCYREGVDIKLKTKSFGRLHGEFDPSSLEVILYLSRIMSKDEMKKVVLHEFVHARNFIVGNDMTHYDSEENVENEAIMTYLRREYIFDFIQQLYSSLRARSKI